ncbi:MAG TPA: hypothetical protein VHP33_33600 [Polyangiaceae bacterium]|nr:hypothetical protein [Polyangiaceae bacterium]
MPWHGNLYQGERASEKRATEKELIEEIAGKKGHPDGGPALTSPVHGKTSVQNVQCLPTGPVAEIMALAQQLLAAAPAPSHMHDLALALVRLLEGLRADHDRPEVG